ncbi:hypothetical protein M3Y97_00815100 [Aphelenchoides bicaudatus]|nr:hypothetical protein M3Y97_00815100 [Aphelenchoides bicaudatus]
MLIEEEKASTSEEKSNEQKPPADSPTDTSNGLPADTSKDEAWPLLNAKDHDEKFDPMQYLQDFYVSAKEDGAMQVVLFFLPGILYRIPQQIEDVLDLGAGPTIYIPIAMRNRVSNFYTSDYSLANRKVLTSWIKNECSFDWTTVCEWIRCLESSHDTAEHMQEVARAKMRAVLDVNVHKTPVVQSIHYKVDEKKEVPKQFDVVTTVFCLEYSSETLDEYKTAVKNASSLVKTGGFLMQGGVMNETEYGFGGKRFKCHCLTREHLLDTLKESGFSTEPGLQSFHLICQDDIFLLISKKL